MPAPPAAFEALYADNAAHVRSVARRILKNNAEVDDVVHDVFLQAWRQLDRFDPCRGNTQAWLAVITRTRVLDRLRRGAVRAKAETASPPESTWRGTTPDPGFQAEQSESMQRIRAAWASLPPLTRRILELTHYENRSQREIASQLQLTLGVVKSRMRQGLSTLRREVECRVGGRIQDGAVLEAALTIESFEAEGEMMGVHAGMLTGVQVLVVDDDVRTGELLGELLSRAGAFPIVRSSAAEAWRLLEHVWPDVMLADISMPDNDGYALMRHVRGMQARNGLGLPAIAFTGRATEFDRARALSAGFRLHISKPVHPSVVIGAIQRMLVGSVEGSR